MIYRVYQYLNSAICKCDQTGEYFNNGTFTSSVRPQEAKGLPTLHHKTNIVHGDEMSICLAQVFNLHSRNTTTFSVVFLPHGRDCANIARVNVFLLTHRDIPPIKVVSWRWSTIGLRSHNYHLMHRSYHEFARPQHRR